MSKLPVPEEFDFTRPASWPAWKIRFQRYRTATKLDREDGSVQVSTLIYTLGKEADRVFQSFIFNNANEEHDPQNDYDTVLAKFEDYFIPKRNVIHERAKFHQTQQKQSENIEIFVRQLYEMAEHCSFSNKEESIRDQLVFGLKDKNISRKLQLEANLSLSKAIEIARNYETVNSQVQSQTQMNVDSIRHSRQGQFNTRSSSNRSRGFRGGTTMRGASTSRGVTWQGSNAARGGQWHPRSGSQDQYNLKCGKCNRCHAMSDRCPAQGKRCNACHKLNHFEVVCRSKNRYRPRPNTNRNINEIYEEAEEQFDSYEEFFLNAIDNNLSKDPWRVSVLLNSEDVNFKIDTGADVTVISKTQFEHLTKKTQLLKSQIVLNSPGGIVHCLGGFWAKIQVGKTVTKEKIYVIDSNCENLLGRKAITELHLINRIDQVDSSVFGDINSQALKCRPVKIILKEDNEPYSLSTPRRIPIPLLKKVEDELNRMKALGVIEEITEPTDWCAPMVPILKREGKIRICADFKNLNKYLKRERYVLPTMDDMLHKLSGSKLFSKVDLSSGFWQIPLDPDTAKLTTFITPFGRFFYKRLPFGISSAPEIFQRVMTEILQNSPAICYIDDTLIYSKDESSHDKHIQETLNKLRKAGIKLNKEKCEFRKEEIKFLGYVINKEGIKPDVDKVKAIQALAEPTDVSGLRRILGMVQYLARHIPCVTEVLHPLYELLNKDRAWVWGPPQQKSFNKIKELVTTAPTLKFYDINKPTVVSADASSFGLGAVLMQENDEGNLNPVAYASRTLTPAERRYAQLEKECLAIVWACEKFQRYLVGLEHFQVLSDHKPLIPIINKKDIPDTPMRCQRMLIRLMRFNLTVTHTAGKNLVVADALSRSPLSTEGKANEHLNEEVEIHVNAIKSTWPVSDQFLNKIREKTEKDVILKTVLQYVEEGWPYYKVDVKLAARNFFDIRGELSCWEGILIKSETIVIPLELREDVLEKIHSGHFGVTKCKERAKQTVWWPGIGRDICDRISSCSICINKSPAQRSEPLISSEIPDRPYQKVGTDLFEFNNKHYIVTMDYYSKNIDIEKLPSQTAGVVIEKLKKCFAQNGVPEIVVSDNGPCFHSHEFKEFSKEWNFAHKTSSPRYPQANGQAEAGVKIAKQILAQDEPHLALMTYRATPVQSTGVSPSELAFGRILKTNLPILPYKLLPKTQNADQILDKCLKSKEHQRKCFDKHHGARNLPELQPGDPVVVKINEDSNWSIPGRIEDQCAPRSYLISTPKGILRRNRKHIKLAYTKPWLPENIVPLDLSTPTGFTPHQRSREQTFQTPQPDSPKSQQTPQRRDDAIPNSNNLPSTPVNEEGDTGIHKSTMPVSNKASLESAPPSTSQSRIPQTSHNYITKRSGREVKIPARYI